MSVKGKNVARSRIAGVGDGSLTTSSKYPWQDIRRDYVEGIEDAQGDLYFPTHADLAEKYGVKRRATIGARAADENWTDQRAAFRASLAKVRRRKRVTELSEEASKFDLNALSISRVGMQLVQRRMSELLVDVQGAANEENKHYQETGVRKTVRSGVSARELRELGGAAEQFHSLAGRVFGDVEDDSAALLPQETMDERSAAREMTVTHEHHVSVERATVIEVATVVAEIEAQVREASERAASQGHVAEQDPQEVIDAEVVDAEAS